MNWREIVLCSALSSVQVELLAVLAGALAGEALEEAGKVLRVLEAEVVGDDADVVGRGGEALLGDGYDVARDHFLGRVAGLFLDKVAEIAGSQVDEVGEVGHRGDGVAVFGLFEIGFQLAFETADNLRVDLVAHDELAVVEAVEIL